MQVLNVSSYQLGTPVLFGRSAHFRHLRTLRLNGVTISPREFHGSLRGCADTIEEIHLRDVCFKDSLRSLLLGVETSLLFWFLALDCDKLKQFYMFRVGLESSKNLNSFHQSLATWRRDRALRQWCRFTTKSWRLLHALRDVLMAVDGRRIRAGLATLFWRGCRPDHEWENGDHFEWMARLTSLRTFDDTGAVWADGQERQLEMRLMALNSE